MWISESTEVHKHIYERALSIKTHHQ